MWGSPERGSLCDRADLRVQEASRGYASSHTSPEPAFQLQPGAVIGSRSARKSSLSSYGGLFLRVLYGLFCNLVIIGQRCRGAELLRDVCVFKPSLNQHPDFCLFVF